MALETVVYPQDQFGHGCKEFNTMGGGGGAGGTGGWGYDYMLQEEGLSSGNWDYSLSSSLMQNVKDSVNNNYWDPNSSPEAAFTGSGKLLGDVSLVMKVAPATSSGRRKRRRNKSCKNKEELENQRMTHIAVERNRRKQMNEYLAVIRSLMPASYVQRGDQASIIGGAINFVKELEQHLQNLEAQKSNTTINEQQQQQQQQEQLNISNNDGFLPPLFSDFFSFPQYSIESKNSSENEARPQSAANRPSANADIEVTMAESHVNLKIRSKGRPRQLLKIVAGLQCLWLTVLHLNVTTVEQIVLYTISLKLEDGGQLSTVEEIADAVNHLVGRIHEEALLS